MATEKQIRWLENNEQTILPFAKNCKTCRFLSKEDFEDICQAARIAFFNTEIKFNDDPSLRAYFLKILFTRTINFIIASNERNKKERHYLTKLDGITNVFDHMDDYLTLQIEMARMDQEDKQVLTNLINIVLSREPLTPIRRKSVFNARQKLREVIKF